MPLRLWLRDRDRRPDPAVLGATGRRAVAVGTIAWVGATIAVLAFPEAVGADDDPAVLVTCGVGVTLGLAGLVYTGRRRG